jgi:hypothetical protein
MGMLSLAKRKTPKRAQSPQRLDNRPAGRRTSGKCNHFVNEASAKIIFPSGGPPCLKAINMLKTKLKLRIAATKTGRLESTLNLRKKMEEIKNTQISIQAAAPHGNVWAPRLSQRLAVALDWRRREIDFDTT